MLGFHSFVNKCHELLGREKTGRTNNFTEVHGWHLVETNTAPH